jgi:AcrR family transcriptional regulator
MARRPSEGQATGRRGTGATRAKAQPVNESAAAAAPAASPRDRIVDALMELAAERRWQDIELTDVAERAGVTLAEFRDLFPSKGAVLGAFSRRIDRQVLEGTDADLSEETVKERLFVVLMRRLVALAPYKTALRCVMQGVKGDPLSLAALNQLAVNSHRFMLAAAGIDTEGPLGAIKVQGSVLLWSRVLDTWFRDDDPGLARTMATLDRELTRGGRIVSGLNDACRMAAPFRALFQSAAEGGRRFRERQRADRRSPRDGGDEEGYVSV